MLDCFLIQYRLWFLVCVIAPATPPPPPAPTPSYAFGARARTRLLQWRQTPAAAYKRLHKRPAARLATSQYDREVKEKKNSQEKKSCDRCVKKRTSAAPNVIQTTAAHRERSSWHIRLVFLSTIMWLHKLVRGLMTKMMMKWGLLCQCHARVQMPG